MDVKNGHVCFADLAQRLLKAFRAALVQVVLDGCPDFAAWGPLAGQTRAHVFQQYIAVPDFGKRAPGEPNDTAQFANFARRWWWIKQVEDLLEAPAGHPHVMDGVRVVSTQDLWLER